MWQLENFLWKQVAIGFHAKASTSDISLTNRHAEGDPKGCYYLMCEMCNPIKVTKDLLRCFVWRDRIARRCTEQTWSVVAKSTNCQVQQFFICSQLFHFLHQISLCEVKFLATNPLIGISILIAIPHESPLNVSGRKTSSTLKWSKA